MSVFAPMIDTLFASAVSCAATYQPSAGAAQSIRVIARAPDVAAPVFQAESVTRSLRLDVRKIEIAEPEEGAEITLEDGRAGSIRSWESDSEGLLWLLDMDPA